MARSEDIKMIGDSSTSILKHISSLMVEHPSIVKKTKNCPIWEV